MSPRILMIEDDADAREVLQFALEAEGLPVAMAADGAEGIALAATTRPDVVLVDLGLPGLDGYEVARRIRDTLGDRVRLIALTGYGRSEDRQRTAEAGFDEHLLKPVDVDEILSLLSD
ncbi:MAG: response regulator [Candidatus Rokuibacteriota bacterium]|nr:MAG: response regulator [Candidatus Rokubacteria bacterium]